MASLILLRDASVEHVVLAGDRVHSRRSVLPRHAVRARFANWRVRLLAATYSRAPLLCGLSGAP
jgi:hypothetical protein